MLAHPEDARGPQAGEAGIGVAVGLTRFEEIVLKRKLRKICPSEPWVEAQINIATDKDRWGQPIRYRYHDVHVFPPGGEQTKMIRCPACGIFNPPNAFEHGKCLDHARHEGWGPSNLASTIAALARRRRRRRGVKLEPEDAASLREEIENFCNNSNNIKK
jgi:hypothetical protein